MEAIITSIAGISLSAGAYALKVGGLKMKNRIFYDIAKFILTNIFNELKDKDSIKNLQKILIDKFNNKSRKELKSFLLELKRLEELQKQYNNDDFFEMNKVKIVNDTVNIKEYFNKKLLIKEFCIFVFSNVYEIKVDSEYFRSFRFELLEDFALNDKISAVKLQTMFMDIYKSSNDLNQQKFDLLNKKFKDNKQELLDIVSGLKGELKTGGKHTSRGLDMIVENLQLLKFDRDMFEVKQNNKVDLNKSVSNSSEKSLIEKDIKNVKKNTIKRMGSISISIAENVSLF